MSPYFNFETTYNQLPQTLHRPSTGTNFPQAKIAIYNEALARALGLIGTFPLETPTGLAMAYAGHQFGHFTMLGDGRALLLGEHLTPLGTRVDIQLKGAGPTFYSRGGDGLAGLGPMFREYIMSEALYALGIPTTRSLAVVATGQPIQRVLPQPGAYLARVASSHLRVGTFEYGAHFLEIEELQALADYAINRHYPYLNDAKDKYLRFFERVCERQGKLIAQWQLVGFIHGVMNTDNMTLSGETIDYGPCAFMDTYHPETVFSSIDRVGRYSYKNQPAIGAWNLSKLATAIAQLLTGTENAKKEALQQALRGYYTQYNHAYLTGLRQKLGLTAEPQPEDTQLIQTLFEVMETHKLDYTQTFVKLTENQGMDVADFNNFLALLNQRGVDREVMRRSNPYTIPRNHLVEAALKGVEAGDNGKVHELLQAVTQPFVYTKGYDLPPAGGSEGYRTYCGT